MAFTPDYPAKIIPIDLSKCGGSLIAMPGSYVAHFGDVRITFKFIRNVLAGCFGGGGFVLLKAVGCGGGAIMENILAPGEEILVDSRSMVGFSETSKYNVKSVESCFNCCFGGEGCFYTSVTGLGLVIVQSLSKIRLGEGLLGINPRQTKENKAANNIIGML